MHTQLFFTTRAAGTVLMVAMLGGCATPQTMSPGVTSESVGAEAKRQQAMVVEEYLSSNARLQSVAARILTRGRALCGTSVGGNYGMTVWSLSEVRSPLWKEILQSNYGFSEAVQVISVDPDGPASQAGVKVGDKLLAVDGAPVSTGNDALKGLQERLDGEAKYGVPVEISVLQSGREMKLSLTPNQACKFHVTLAQDDSKNAYADGKGIYVHKGMMDFIKSDEELALVVSHELAHNAMLHIDAKKKNATMGSLLGALVDVAAAFGGVNTNGDMSRIGAGVGGRAYSVEFEQEADYVGLYLMANAGYDIGGAANFWRRMAVANPATITMKSDHPTSSERFVALESTVAEIHRKMTSGEPLKPEMKAGHTNQDAK